MKKFLKKSLISILIVMLLFNFLINSCQVVVYADDDEPANVINGMLNGLVGLLTWVPRLSLIAPLIGIHALISSMAQVGEVKDLEGSGSDFLITPFHIFFNSLELTDVNFFNFNSGKDDSPIRTFRIAVAGWYYTIRTIAAMILLVVLAYIGIRMALSTIASERAMYKKMLVDWVTSLALLFFLHYIMVFVLMINDALVTAMAAIAKSAEMTKFLDNLINVALGVFPEDVTLSFAAIGVYAVIVIQTLIFLISYIKRMLNVGFLIIISPLITITYSIDKIGDGKAQALNSWLKEFIFGILIQPFHCILYLAYAKTAFDLLTGDNSAGSSSMAKAIFAILCLAYIKTGEELIKKIFGFDQAQSAAGMAAGTAMTVAALQKTGSAANKLGKGAAGISRSLGKNAQVGKIKNKLGETIKTNREARDAAKNWAREHNKDRSAYKEKKKDFKKTLKSTDEKDMKKQEALRKRAIAERANKAINGNPFDPAVIKGVKKVGQKVSNTANSIKGTKFVSQMGKGAKKVSESKFGQFTKRAGKYTAGIPIGLAKDAGKYVANNKGKIASSAAGAFYGLAVTAATGNGAAGMAVYSGVKGFGEGRAENSTATLRKDGEDLAKAISRITGEDGGDVLARVLATGDGNGYKDLNKRLDELMKALKRFGLSNGQARYVTGKIQSEAISNPKNLNAKFIESLINDPNSGLDSLSSKDKESAKELIGGQIKFSAEAQLYNNLNNMRNMGKDLDDMTYIAGSFGPQSHSGISTMDPRSIEEIDSEEVVTTVVGISEILGKIGDKKTSISSEELAATNSKIDSLSRLIEQYNSATGAQQQAIVSAINSNETALNSINTALGREGELTTDNFSTSMNNYMKKLDESIKSAKTE